MSVATEGSAAASAAVSAWRTRHAETAVFIRSPWRCANPGIVRPLEIVRTPEATRSVAHLRPAVSSTQASTGSAIRKLLW